MKTWSYAAVGALLLAALGCHDDTTAPAEPRATVPQADVSAAAALPSVNGRWMKRWLNVAG
jgi:predicted outer membrane protein